MDFFECVQLLAREVEEPVVNELLDPQLSAPDTEPGTVGFLGYGIKDFIGYVEFEVVELLEPFDRAARVFLEQELIVVCREGPDIGHFGDSRCQFQNDTGIDQVLYSEFPVK